VIVTVDGQQGLKQLSSQPESVRQLAAAECVVVTKSDLASPQSLTDLRHAMNNLNPVATIVNSIGGDAAVPVFTATAGEPQRRAVVEALKEMRPGLQRHASCNHEDQHAHGIASDHEHHALFHSRVSTLGFYIDHEITWSGLAAWWHLVSSHYGDSLLRSKGLLHINDSARPQVFMQTVGKVFHSPDVIPAWPDTDLRSRLVCIGVSLDEEWLRRSLAALRIDEPGLMPSTLAELSFLVSTQSE